MIGDRIMKENGRTYAVVCEKYPTVTVEVRNAEGELVGTTTANRHDGKTVVEIARQAGIV